MLKNLEIDTRLAPNSLTTILKNDRYRLEKSTFAKVNEELTYEMHKQSKQDLINTDEPKKARELLDARVFVLNPSTNLKETINRRCFDMMNEQFFEEMKELSERIYASDTPLSEINTPVGAAEAIQLIELARLGTQKHTFRQKIVSFMDVFQGYNRSYSTWQQKYLRKYFTEAVWLKTDSKLDPLQTVMPYYECTR